MTMAELADRVASALNMLADHVFTDALSDLDGGSFSDLVELFCQVPEQDEDPGM